VEGKKFCGRLAGRPIGVSLLIASSFLCQPPMRMETGADKGGGVAWRREGVAARPIGLPLALPFASRVTRDIFERVIGRSVCYKGTKVLAASSEDVM